MERLARHRGDIREDKVSAGRLNNVFASVFTLENRTVEEREEKLYYVCERGPAQTETSKGARSQWDREGGICHVAVRAGHSPETQNGEAGE